ncbi:copper chaperone PCu(A)C [Kocuria sp. HSID16901]|uniref:copper chaperone PCu(A)C n=1 Tax=Kocuria sp. HSID16901 TaxID=2419505 RepID=UPI00069EF449|nr:copper chaperone PCu(A)C [Kocuria sp. HSID16901]MCT1368207.1 copper chaperone PCu(A)C [Rothia sp. p3-SID1597]RUQ23231.1 copper chaperone PCu(A)C [Kocuria sp. HSID16901]
MKNSRHLLAPVVVLAAATLTLTACGGAQEASQNSSSSSSASASSSDTGLKVEQPWAKAAKTGMTAVFGKLTNTTDHDIVISSATTNASDEVQLHETVIDPKTGGSSMQEKKDGFTLKPGETKELKPGGDHIMLMKLKCSLLAGDSLKVTLNVKDGQSVVMDAPIRDYTGAKENYDPSQGSDSSEHSMDHGSSHSMDHGSGDDMSSMSSGESELPSCSS